MTIELLTPAAEAKRAEIERDFIALAKKGVSKGSKPDHVRCAPLPRNFKGVVKLPETQGGVDPASEDHAIDMIFTVSSSNNSVSILKYNYKCNNINKSLFA